MVIYAYYKDLAINKNETRNNLFKNDENKAC